MMRIIGRITSRLPSFRTREDRSGRQLGPLARMLEDDVNNLDCLTRALAVDGRHNPERETGAGAHRGVPGDMMSSWFSGDPMLTANLASQSQKTFNSGLSLVEKFVGLRSEAG